MEASFPKPHSCQICQKFILKLDDRKAENLDEADTDIRKSIKFMQSVIEPRYRHLGLLNSSTVVFDYTLTEMMHAGAQGCMLCRWILEDPEEDARSALQMSECSTLAATLTSNYIYFGVLDSSEGESVEMMTREGMQSKFRRLSATFQLIAAADDPAGAEIPTRPINIYPASQESFDLVRSWLQTCLETHEMCPKPAMNFMPTRVIEIVHVGERRLIRLKESTGLRPAEPYAALSYCWGGEQKCQTTKATLSHHLLFGLGFKDLPASIRHAIIVADQLNIRLLWIDSLCIIQDDEADKAFEIALMPSIYSQATVTITASRASSVEEGFLQKRPLMGLEAPDAVFKLPFRTSSGSGDMGSVVLLPPTDECIEPLDQRGWTMQERFLSRRIIEYGTRQTRWSCRKHMDSKYPTDGFKNNAVYNNKRSDYLFIRGLELVLTEGGENTVDLEQFENHLQFWHHLIRIYTDRSLSESKDRLPAVSGIAASFAKLLRDTYCAGLWRSRLATELLWIKWPSSGCKPLARPNKYQAPSWSWAAINGAVKDLLLPLDELVDNHFKVLDCQIRLPGKSAYRHIDGRFGSVSSGKLVVSGRLQTALFMHDGTGNPDSESGQLFFPDTLFDERPKGMLPAKMYPDALEQEFASPNRDSIQVFLLKIVVAHDRAKGLVLRRTDDGEYSRLGVFDFGYGRVFGLELEGSESSHQRFRRDFVWLDQCEVETITIV